MVVSFFLGICDMEHLEPMDPPHAILILERATGLGKNLMVAGNFNLTNVEELNSKLVDRGQHPVFDTDTQAILGRDRLSSGCDE